MVSQNEKIISLELAGGQVANVVLGPITLAKLEVKLAEAAVAQVSQWPSRTGWRAAHCKPTLVI